MVANEQDSSDKGRRWWPPSAWSLGAFAVAATAIIAVVGFCLSWYVWHRLDLQVIGTDRSAAVFDVARSTVTLLGVLTLGGAAAVAYRRQQTLEQQHEIEDLRSRRERDQETRAERADLHARYQQAAAQLGHEEPIIRVAGIYALEALATEWATLGDTIQKDVCIDLLCGYLRSTRGIKTLAPSTDEERTIMVESERDVRSTVTTVIARHLHDPSNPSIRGDWSSHSYDFSGVHFHAANFACAHFDERASFGGAEFHSSTVFSRAKFSDRARFEGAHFYDGAEFDNVLFGGHAGFTLAQFHQHSDFHDTHFEDAWFVGARFHDLAGFDGAHFHGPARFHSTQFECAVFSRAEFEGRAIFDKAQFHDSAEFENARFIRRASYTATHFHSLSWFHGADFHTADFVRARFDDQANFDGIHFLGPADFNDARFGDNADFAYTHFHKSVSFGGGQLSGVFDDTLIVPEHLTPALRRFGFAELPDSIDCDKCQGRFPTRSAST